MKKRVSELIAPQVHIWRITRPSCLKRVVELNHFIQKWLKILLQFKFFLIAKSPLCPISCWWTSGMSMNWKMVITCMFSTEIWPLIILGLPKVWKPPIPLEWVVLMRWFFFNLMGERNLSTQGADNPPSPRRQWWTKGNQNLKWDWRAYDTSLDGGFKPNATIFFLQLDHSSLSYDHLNNLLSTL